MPTAVRKKAKRGIRVMERQNAEALILAIGRDRDRGAFRELYALFQKPALNLAYYIVRNRESAEEAVQEAMIRVWKSSAGFRGGSAKSWIMKIVARESTKQMHRRSRYASQAKKETQRQDSWERAPQSDVADVEVVTVLRQVLDELPPADRLIVSMYYSGSCSQDEIAEACGLSQRTVSEHLKKVRDYLRSRLTEAGFASMGETAMVGTIAAVIESEFSVPSNLEARVMGRINDVSKGNGDAPGRMSLAKIGVLSLAVISGLVGLTSVGTDYGRTPAEMHPGEESPLALAAVPSKGKLWHWDFNQPDLTNLKQIEGQWQHQPKGGPDGSGCMKVSAQSHIVFEMEISLSRLPVMVQFKAKIERNEPLYMLQWSGSIPKVALVAQVVGDVDKARNRKWSTYRCYVTKQGIDIWRDGRRCIVVLSNPGKIRTLVMKCSGGESLDDIEIFEVSQDVVPDSTRFFQEAEKSAFIEKNVQILIPALCEPVDVDNSGEIWHASCPQAPPFTETESKTWQFKSRQDLLDFAVYNGSWKHLPLGGKDGTGCVEIEEGVFGALFNFNAERYPFLITMRCRRCPNTKRKGWGYPEILSQGQNKIAYLTNAFRAVNAKKTGEWVTIKMYVTKDYWDMWANNERIQLYYAPKSPGDFGHLLTEFRTQIDLLNISPLRHEQLPEVKRFRIALKKIKEAKGNDDIPLPSLKSPFPGKNVSAVFLGYRQREAKRRAAKNR